MIQITYHLGNGDISPKTTNYYTTDEVKAITEWRQQFPNAIYMYSMLKEL